MMIMPVDELFEGSVEKTGKIEQCTITEPGSDSLHFTFAILTEDLGHETN